MACIVIAYLVMACIVMACIVMADTGMAYTVMAYVIMDYTITVMDYAVMAYVVMAYEFMAYIVMAASASGSTSPTYRRRRSAAAQSDARPRRLAPRCAVRVWAVPSPSRGQSRRPSCPPSAGPRHSRWLALLRASAPSRTVARLPHTHVGYTTGRRRSRVLMLLEGWSDAY